MKRCAPTANDPRPTISRPQPRPWRALATGCCAGLLLCGASLDLAAYDPPASDMPAAVPPFLSTGTGPNLVISIDDSNSMRKSYLAPGDWPKDFTIGQRWLASPDSNPLYYDPDTDYEPALDADGNPLPVEDSLGHVLAYPFSFDGNTGCSDYYVNLASQFQPVVYDPATTKKKDPVDKGGSCGPGATLATGLPEDAPYYYRFDPHAGYRDNDPDPGVADYVACSLDPTASDYTADCTSCGVAHPTPDETTPDPCFEPQPVEDTTNFITWYKFYRTRLLTAKTVLTRVLPSLDDSVRVTYQGLEDRLAGSGPAGFEPGDFQYDNLVTNFGTYADKKADLFDWLFDVQPGAITLLVSAHIRAGEFVRQGIALADKIAEHRTLADPGGTNPLDEKMCKAQCRKNFHLMLTDGAWEDYWDGFDDQWALSQPTELSGTGVEENEGSWFIVNWDNTTFDLPAEADSPFGEIHYKPRGPYKDTNFAMLADAAFYYWAEDLLEDVDNEVPILITEVAKDTEQYDEVNFWNPNNNPADWQHLSLFVIAFGVEGGIDIPTDDNGDLTFATPPYGTWQEFNGAGVKDRGVADDGFPSCLEEPYLPLGDLTPSDESQTRCQLALYGFDTAKWIPAGAKVDDLYHAAINSRGRYFQASAPKTLIDSFSAVLSTVSAAAKQDNANAPVAINAGGLSDDTRIYQAVSNTEDWSGEVRVLRVSRGYGVGNCPEEPRGELCEDSDTPYWSTRESGSFPAENERVIYTMADGDPADFDDALFGKLSQRQKEGLTGGVAMANVANARIDWMRGVVGAAPHADDTLTEFRERDTPMGDILGGGPVVVGAPRKLFSDSDYLAFKKDLNSDTAGNQTRGTMVYVAANDGMLHAFAASSGKPALTEVFAYLPGAVYDDLSDLPDPTYGEGQRNARASFVLGPLNYSDAKLTDSPTGRNGWRTVLVGALGSGAQGLYALDITEPDPAPATAYELVLWEFTDASGNDADDGDLDGRDMGYNLAEPEIVRIDENPADNIDPTWVVLVGNGYESTDATGEDASACTDDDDPAPTNCTISQTGNAVLYVLNLGGGDATRIKARMDTGVGMAEDPTGNGRTNGLTVVSVLDKNGDLIADRAYAGDLFGNLWRFNLTNTTLPPTRIFQAKDGAGNPQPITSRIKFTRHPSGGYMLLFGTGRFINDDDKTDLSVQTFYGIWDDGGEYFDDTQEGNMAVPTRQDLIQHKFLETVTVQDDTTGVVVSRGRTSTTTKAAPGSADEPVSSPSRENLRGWLIDLLTDQDNPEGERVVVAPTLRPGSVFFTSMIPGDCCSAGGSSWDNALDVLDGSRLTYTPFDYNLDGSLNKFDLLDVGGWRKVPGSGIFSEGILSEMKTFTAADGTWGIQSGTAGSGGETRKLPGLGGWRTWLQIE